MNDVIYFLDSPDNHYANKQCAIFLQVRVSLVFLHRAQVHISNRSPVGSSNTKGMQSCSISLSSINYIWFSFLLDLLCINIMVSLHEVYIIQGVYKGARWGYPIVCWMVYFIHAFA